MSQAPPRANVSNFASKLAQRLKINPAFHLSTQSKNEREIELKAKQALRKQMNKGRTDDYNNLFKKINDNARFQRAVIPIQNKTLKLLSDTSAIQSNYINMYQTHDKLVANQDHLGGITHIINGSDVVSPANEFEHPSKINQEQPYNDPNDSKYHTVNQSLNHSKNNSMAGLIP